MGEASSEKKMLINDDRSQYIYENKQKADNFPDEKDDISTQSHDIYTKKRAFCRNQRLPCRN